MEISPLLLSLLLLWSAVFGAVLGMINDVNRIIRVFLGVRYTQNGFERLYKYPLPILKKPLGELKTLPKRGFVSVIIFLQDLLFFIIAGVGVAILNYEFNEGKFRIFTLLAILVGFLLYYFTIGKLVILASELIVFSIKAIFLMIFTNKISFCLVDINKGSCIVSFVLFIFVILKLFCLYFKSAFCFDKQYSLFCFYLKF